MTLSKLTESHMNLSQLGIENRSEYEIMFCAFYLNWLNISIYTIHDHHSCKGILRIINFKTICFNLYQLSSEAFHIHLKG